MTQATRAGFFGGLVIDFPHSTKAKKVFLVLMTGGAQALPKALGTGADDTQEDQISYSNDRWVKFSPAICVVVFQLRKFISVVNPCLIMRLLKQT